MANSGVNFGAQFGTKSPAGVIGYFRDPEALLVAMKQVRDAGFENFDAFTPFPVHGLEQAQGLKRSPLPFVAFGAGLVGGLFGFGLQYWTSAIDWKLIVGGKPFNSWPAFIPVTFELCVLFAALSTVGAMFLMNGLPNIFKRSFDPSLTRDRFAILIGPPEKTPRAGFKTYQEAEASALLKRVGAQEVRAVQNEGWF